MQAINFPTSVLPAHQLLSLVPTLPEAELASHLSLQHCANCRSLKLRGSPQLLANFDVKQRKKKKLKKKRQHTKLFKSFEFQPNCPGQGYNIPQEAYTAPTSDPSQETSPPAAGESSSEQQIKLPSTKPQPASTHSSKVQEAPSQTRSPKLFLAPCGKARPPLHCTAV